MTTIELRSLATGENKKIVIPKDFEKLLKTWEELRKESYNKSIEPLEIFYAGYILANPMVKEQFKIFIEKEIKNNK
jgi:hypothetical protein